MLPLALDVMNYVMRGVWYGSQTKNISTLVRAAWSIRLLKLIVAPPFVKSVGAHFYYRIFIIYNLIRALNTYISDFGRFTTVF